MRTRMCAVVLVASAPGWTAGAGAQVLIDRVLARISGDPLTLSDVRAALAMGLVVARSDEMALATEQLIQRRLLLAEVERFPPPEPAAAAIDQEEARIRARLGSIGVRPASDTGIDERQIRQNARDTLRIRAYLDQRFGTGFQVDDQEARAYYAANPGEFTRDGVVAPFEAVEADVRQRAAAARRETTIDQWMADLRQRADVTVNP